jgi:5-hydroxyisourate hydrolase
MASIVCGAAASQRAVKWRSSPTLIFRLPIPGGYVASNGPDTPDLPQTASSAVPTMPTISTHLLDTEAGSPARGVHVILYKLGEDDRPIRLTQALTDDDGRIRDLLGRPMSAGIYRLEFNLAGVRGPGTGDDRFFRRLTLELRVDDVARSYHVPLLLAPFSLTTYRGS